MLLVPYYHSDIVSSQRTGYFGCFYKEDNLKIANPFLYTQLTSIDSSIILSQSFDFQDNYSTGKAHTWPGLTDDFTDRFGAFYSGYLSIQQAGDYQFQITAYGSTDVYIGETNELFFSCPYDGQPHESNSTKLDQGLVLLHIFYTSFTSVNKLKVEFHKIGEKYQVLDQTVFIQGSYAPSFVSMNSTTVYVNSTVHLQPSYRLAPITVFSIEPALPTGLSIDSKTGVISGIPISPSYAVYTLTMVNPIGSAQTTFSLAVSNTPVHGLLGKYYRYIGEKSICKQKRMNDAYLNLLYTSIDTDFYQQQTPHYQPMTNKPAMIFSNTTFIHWEGYLKVEEEGKWDFQAQVIDGFQMRIDNTWYSSYAFRCNDHAQTVMFDTTLTVGYHPILIEWFENDRDYLIQMEVKLPSSEEYIPLSSDFLYYAPIQPFSYSHSTVMYFVNQKILSNKPLFTGIEATFPSFESSPPLPSGLSILPDGSIDGLPTKVSERTIYTITATINSLTYQAFLDITIYHVDKPTNVGVYDNDGNTIHTVTIPIYRSIPSYSINCTSVGVHYHFSQDLPKGITFNTNTNRFEGFPTETYHKTIVIQAINDGGSTEYELEIIVPECEYGHWFYSSSENSLGSYYLIKDGKVIQEEIHSSLRDYAFVFCVPLDTYELHVYFPASQARVSIVRDDQSVYFEDHLVEGHWMNRTLSLIVTEPPRIIFDVPSIAGLRKQTLSLTFTASGIHTPYVFIPPLPKNVDFGENVITGTFTEIGSYTYTVVASNDAGSMEISFTFWIETCDETHYMVYGEKKGCMTNDHIQVIREWTQQTELSIDLDKDFGCSFMMCFARSDVYLLSINSTVSTVKGGALSLKSNDLPINHYIYLNNQPQQIERVRLLSLIPEDSSFRYWRSDKKISKKWNEVKFNDNKWSLTNHDNWSSFTSSIRSVYFRYGFEMNSEDLIASFGFALHFIGGVVIYLNGQQVLSLNMPSSWNSGTFAVEDEDYSEWTHFTISKDYLTAGMNIFAIELHCLSSQINQPISFDLHSIELTSSNQVVSVLGSVKDCQETPYGPPENAFDFDYSTWWGVRSRQAWIQYSFNHGRQEFANYAMLRGTNNGGKYHPMNFTIFGIYNSSSTGYIKDQLAHVYNPYIFQTTYELVAVKLQSNRPYSAYELEVYDTNSGTAPVTLNQLSFVTIPSNRCPAMKKLPATDAGDYVFQKCNWRSIGSSVLRCISNNTQAKWAELDTSTCLPRFPGVNEAFIDTNYAIHNCTMDVFTKKVKKDFMKTFLQTMMIHEEEFLLYLEHDCSSPEYPIVCLSVRLYPNHLAADYVYNQINEFNNNATAIFNKIASSSPLHMSIEVTSQSILRERMETLIVVLIVIIVVLSILVLLLLGYVFALTKDRRTLKRKRLTKGKKSDIKTNETASLLSNEC